MTKTLEQQEEKSQAFTQHLRDLRVCLIRSLIAIVAGAFICFYFSEQIFAIIRQPILPYLPTKGLIYTGPMDKFMAFIKLSISSGVILTTPFWLYQVWRFISPGLYQKEKKGVVAFVFSGTFLFLTGVSFSYFVVLPMAFKFLMTFGGTEDQPMIAIDHYLSFVTRIAIMFGAAFELPLVLVSLGMMGIVSKEFLKAKRKYAVMILAVLSAIITPPDLLSMLLMLGPMLFLYEISIFFVGYFARPAPVDNTP